jgi:hypothetical protein
MRCTVMKGKEGREFEGGGDDDDARNSVIGGGDVLWLPAAEDGELVATDQVKLKTFGPLPELLEICNWQPPESSAVNKTTLVFCFTSEG